MPLGDGLQGGRMAERVKANYSESDMRERANMMPVTL